jgi:hypothetical protein
MIKLVAFLLVVLAGVVVVASDWPDDPRLGIGEERVLAELRDGSVALGRPIARQVTRHLSRVPGVLRPDTGQVDRRIGSASIRLLLLRHLVVPMLPVVIAGALLGLSRRQAAGRGGAWSSSTAFMLGSYMLLSCLAVAIVLVFSSIPSWLVYLPFMLLAWSCYLIVGNLPCRV